MEVTDYEQYSTTWLDQCRAKMWFIFPKSKRPTSLWTDFALLGDPLAGILAALGMNDYRNIATRRAGYGKNRVIRLTPQGTLEMHRESVSWLSRELGGRDGRPVVVVTHMAPHRGSLHPEFKHDPISPAFVSDLDPQVRMAAGLWIHGHTHDTFNYRIGKCRVVCNPREPVWRRIV